jgi:hypothetical protein
VIALRPEECAEKQNRDERFCIFPSIRSDSEESSYSGKSSGQKNDEEGLPEMEVDFVHGLRVEKTRKEEKKFLKTEKAEEQKDAEQWNAELDAGKNISASYRENGNYG